MLRGVPRRAKERDRDRLADGEEPHRELARAEERREPRFGFENHGVRVVANLRAAAALHRHARAQLDVHHLVEREA